MYLEESMSNITKQDLISYIKSIILKYCPYVEDRLSILGNGKSPQLDVVLNICNNETQIMFMFGNSSFKTSAPERATIAYIIDFEELADIIDFIIMDHEVIKNVNLYGKQIDLEFAINWTDKSIKGINCSDIGLNLNFENMEVKKQYLYLLFQRYFTHLEQVPTFKAMKNKYIDSMKNSYFDTLDKTDLIALLNEMSENELKKLLNNLDNDDFIKYVMSDGEKQKARVLSLEDNNKNN